MKIFGATQRVQPNFIICGLNVAAVIKCMRNFDGTGANAGVGPHYIGTLNGTYKVYVVPQMDADEFVLGYKGTNFLETGLTFESMVA
nr:MAG TPA: major capsid protein [Caudoviricetes sp.]